MVRVGIAGVTGYGGEELLRILAYHPQVRVTYASAREERSKKIQDLFPYLRGVLDLECEVFDAVRAAAAADIVFLALPHGESMKAVPELLGRQTKVIDLSADYRLKEASWYDRYYGFSHTDPSRLQEAVYGLPELCRDQIVKARLVANPGCYPTAATLALLPLLESGRQWLGPLVIDAKSGVTGAGRKAAKNLLHAEVQENFRAYKVLGHPHEGEIRQTIEELRGTGDFVFVPHLLPIRKGILCTIYARFEKASSLDGLRNFYADFYSREPFVKVLAEGEFPEVAWVRDTNQCHIGVGVRADGKTAVLVSVIDNLQKGAGGQAVQNMNLICGFPETQGLR